MIGLGPQAASEAMMDLAALSPNDGLGGFIIGGKKCQELQDNNWENEQGEAVFVPVGDYAEPHHSSCFRAFNLNRENIAHGYSAAVDMSVAPHQPWSEIQALATQYNDEVTVQPRAVGPVPGANEKSVGILENCPLSHMHN